MLNVNPLEPRPVGRGSSPALPSLDIMSYVGIAKRNWPTIVGITLATLGLALAYIMTTPPRFTATSTILIDTRKNQLLGTQQQVVGDQLLDASGVESQVEILKSESIALAVIRELKLADDPTFADAPSFLGSIFGLLSGSGGVEPSVAEREQGIVGAFGGSLTVKRIGLTYAIDVSFTSTSPAKAAEIANAIADAYSVSELESRYQATKRASRWLQDRIQELRLQATTAEGQVQKFRAENNIIDTGRGLLSEQQLADVNGQLATARASTAEAKARLDRITSINRGDVPDATVTDALKNDVITRLRAQYLDIAARHSDWSVRFGVEHEAVRGLANQMRELRRSISDEVNRIAQTYRSEYEIAQARELSFQTSLAALVEGAGATGQAQVALRDLESTAQTYRNLYDNFLQRFMEATQQQTFPISEARVITAATAPTGKSSPKSARILAVATVLGLGLGFAGALAREHVGTSVFRTLKEVEDETGIECLGILPMIGGAPARPGRVGFPARGDVARPSNADVSRHAIDVPFSRFAEVVRSIKVAADLSGLTRRNRVIGLVSALPNEGKSTISANLAAVIAAGGRSVLLIDGDLRNPSLTRTLSPNAGEGLLEALRLEQPVDSLIQHDPDLGYAFLPAVVRGRIWQSAELLSSNAMSALIEAARKKYDYVVIDLPPVIPVVDVRAMAHMIDGFVMVAEWGATSREVVAEALATVDVLSQRMVGIVLNKANPTQLARLETYKGRYYKSYYQDRTEIAA